MSKPETLAQSLERHIEALIYEGYDNESHPRTVIQYCIQLIFDRCDEHSVKEVRDALKIEDTYGVWGEQT